MRKRLLTACALCGCGLIGLTGQEPAAMNRSGVWLDSFGDSTGLLEI
jgi:hypothetical protein